MNQAGESAEGTAPSAARRTRRESLDSPGSHCSNHKRPIPTPVSKQCRSSAFDTIQPGKSPSLVTAQTLEFPHGPTNDYPVDVLRDRLKLRTSKPAVVRHPATYSRSQSGSKLLE